MEHDLDCALDLIRRLPPNNTKTNLNGILALAPHLADDLLSSVDQPLMAMHCPHTDKQFLICDYNRDGDNDAYRSPWSNIYYPLVSTNDASPYPQESAAFPSQKLRHLEIAANEAFDTYRDLYYGTSTGPFTTSLSSVYMWDLTETTFATVILLKKSSQKDNVNSHWDAIHVIEVSQKPQSKSASYRVTSTVLLGIGHLDGVKVGDFGISGSLTRQNEQELQLESFGHHTINLGKLVEDMESKLRNSLQEVYFGKTRDIMNDLRSVSSLEEKKKMLDVQAKVIGNMYAQ